MGFNIVDFRFFFFKLAELLLGNRVFGRRLLHVIDLSNQIIVVLKILLLPFEKVIVEQAACGGALGSNLFQNFIVAFSRRVAG
ncbi:hypothetical protein D3C74_418100 [compost metagenome]